MNNRLLPNNHGFQHTYDWLKVLDEISTSQIPKFLLERAIQLKSSLLNTMEAQVLLHGDLHLDNILKHHDTWIAIDCLSKTMRILVRL